MLITSSRKVNLSSPVNEKNRKWKMKAVVMLK